MHKKINRHIQCLPGALFCLVFFFNCLGMGVNLLAWIALAVQELTLDQTGLKLRNLPGSASQALGSKVFAMTGIRSPLL